ncbi:hypothetical protein [Microbacterium rhizophilus]
MDGPDPDVLVGGESDRLFAEAVPLEDVPAPIVAVLGGPPLSGAIEAAR